MPAAQVPEVDDPDSVPIFVEFLRSVASTGLTPFVSVLATYDLQRVANSVLLLPAKQKNLKEKGKARDTPRVRDGMRVRHIVLDVCLFL